MSGWAEALGAIPKSLRVPLYITAIAIVVILASLVLISVIRGVKLDLSELKIEVYKTPEAQNCANIVNNLNEISQFGADTIAFNHDQIKMSTEKIFTAESEHASALKRGGIKAVVDRFRNLSETLRGDILSLRQRIEEIEKKRMDVLDTIQKICLGDTTTSKS
jgi:hypothetical protein